MPLSIGEILVVGFHEAIRELRRNDDGTYRRFLGRDLDQAYLDGQIVFAPLGAYVPAPDGTTHEVLQVNAPMTWTRQLEEALVSENARITFVRDMIKKAMIEHDNIVREYLQGNRLAFSRQYTYDRGEVIEIPGDIDDVLTTQEFPDRPLYVCKIYSAFSPVPLRHFIPGVTYGPAETPVPMFRSDEKDLV